MTNLLSSEIPERSEEVEQFPPKNGRNMYSLYEKRLWDYDTLEVCIFGRKMFDLAVVER